MKFFGAMEVEDNILKVGGVSFVDLAKEHGTPLYVFDENLIRDNCRRYIEAFKHECVENRVAYAGKAFLTLAMCQLLKEENMWLDVVSGGELYTAYKSGFPLEKIYFHGNNKTMEEIELGIKLGVGRFVADHLGEIDLINDMASKYNVKQKILFRITPGIEAHTHDSIKTGQIDSKFGFTLLDNNTINAVKYALTKPNVELVGFHSHIGSQIFDTEPFKDEVDIMLSLIKEVLDKTGYLIKELDLGGGVGIYYTEGDNPQSIENFCQTIIDAYNIKCKELDLQPPVLTIEPGRSIVGNAGSTLYTVGAIKEIPEIRKYVSVNGGMTDNIRPALYGAEYEAVVANRVENSSKEKVTVAGKCCESGDILLRDALLPTLKSGDLLAVLATGAYGFSMSSNYNKIPRPGVVFVKDGQSRVVFKRESYEDVIKNELGI